MTIRGRLRLDPEQERKMALRWWELVGKKRAEAADKAFYQELRANWSMAAKRVVTLDDMQ